MKIEILETKTKRLWEEASAVHLLIVNAPKGANVDALEDDLERLSDELEAASDELADAMNEKHEGPGAFVSIAS